LHKLISVKVSILSQERLCRPSPAFCCVDTALAC